LRIFFSSVGLNWESYEIIRWLVSGLLCIALGCNRYKKSLLQIDPAVLKNICLTVAAKQQKALWIKILAPEK